MNEALFKEIVKSFKQGDAYAIDASRALKYADAGQKAKLGKLFPEYYRTTKAGRVMRGPSAKVVADPELAKAKEARYLGEQTVILGGCGHEAAAIRECQQFRMPNVFTYQSAIFPDPRTHGVNVVITEAKPVKLAKAHELYPWGVKLTLRVTGAPEKVTHWLNGFNARIRGKVAE